MQKLVVEIEDEDLTKNILWLLKAFENQGVRVYSDKLNSNFIDNTLCLETLKDIKNRDFTKIKSVSLKEHFKELGI